MPKPLHIIGTAFNSYILVEYEEHLLLIDQQGVHERLLFDRMMKALDTQTCTQELIVPMIVPATRREQQLLEANQALLKSIGLSVESFGETEVSIRSIPMILGQPQAGTLLREILDQLEGERGTISLEKRRAGIVALACRKAVKSKIFLALIALGLTAEALDKGRHQNRAVRLACGGVIKRDLLAILQRVGNVQLENEVRVSFACVHSFSPFLARRVSK
jgi:DNA mismatch repair ATPase MutL